MPAARVVTIAFMTTIIFSQPQLLAGDDIHEKKLLRQEFPDDPYIPGLREHRQTSPAYRSSRSGFFFTQANVDDNGMNVVGDAANEPSIAVDPTDLSKIAIGWRQFDTIQNNFRQAGNAHTTDGGVTWTFPGVIDPGLFRSDPVLDSDVNGVIYYNSLSGDFSCQVFRSYDGGATWDDGVEAWGGDKQWMTIDKSDGIGQGHIYAYWTEAFTTCGPGFFTRSTDGGDSYEACIEIDDSPFWGTLTVGPEGDLYIGGVGPTADFVVVKSVTAQDAGSPVTWESPVTVSLDGTISAFSGDTSPNPGGLLGQTWIATDHSDGSTAGNVYLLGSVERFSNSDPLDVMFARSTDGGLTWSDPVRVNDDPGMGAFQWFGTMSVSPDGRIDAIWLDTRDNPGTVLSSLYYSFSTDAGETWSVNERLSDEFDPHLGWPQQNKMGDYYDMVSDSAGAHLAWAATFNGEQDVYYGRIIAGAFVPAAPALVAPPDGSEDLPLTMSVEWGAAIGAASYRLQVDTDGFFTSPLVDDSTLTGTSYELSGLDTGTEHFWRVNAKSDGGTSPWSDVWSFTTSTNPPAPPTLTTPPDGGTDIPVPVTFEWSDTASGATWHLQVSTDESFSDVVVDEPALAASSYEAAGLDGETLYYWRVNTNNAGGTSVWSSVWSFTTVIATPAAPALLAPPDGFVSQVASILFRWEAIDVAETYHFQLATDDAFSNLVVDEPALGTNTFFVGDLTQGSTYFWRASAANAGGTGPWSEVWSFSVAVTSVDGEEDLIPTNFVLDQNYPNPFNPSTIIRFGVPEKTPVLIEVFDVVGKRVAVLADRTYDAGYYDVSFDAGNLGGGVYFYRLTAREYVETRKLLLLK